MARKVTVVLEDDISGGDAAETVRFALDGRSYEIDLNDKNARKLREALAPWVAGARRSGSTSARADGGRGRSGRSAESGEIRRWASSEGIEVNARGRIPAELRARYEAAHASS